MAKLTAIVGERRGKGHGECFIWEPERKNAAVAAIDAGATSDVGQCGGSYSPEVLVLSHDDDDHIGGALSLMAAAKRTLKELWVPAEWMLLLDQLNRTADSRDSPLGLEGRNITVRAAEQMVAASFARDVAGEPGRGIDLVAIVDGAGAYLDRLGGTLRADRADLDVPATVAWPGDGRMFGAKTVNEVAKRVAARAGALHAILAAALKASLRVRFFSIDYAITQASTPWLNDGDPGNLTIANAAEVWGFIPVLPIGLQVAYALGQLTVQNRRALCTLAWDQSTSPCGGALVWSDSAGDWVAELPTIRATLGDLAVSSAPHHGSAGIAHRAAWQELASHLAAGKPVVSAGGQHNQGYSGDYLGIARTSRGCTRCRGKHAIVHPVRDVSARIGSGVATLLQDDSRCAGCSGH